MFVATAPRLIVKWKGKALKATEDVPDLSDAVNPKSPSFQHLLVELPN